MGSELITAYLNDFVQTIRENDSYVSKLRSPTRRKKKVRPITYVETTNLFTGRHPPWITDDAMYLYSGQLTTYRSAVQALGGFQEPVMLSSDWTWALHNRLMAWRYRDTAGRGTNDAYYKVNSQRLALLQLTGQALIDFITQQNMLDPLTQQLFDPPELVNNYAFWRFRLYYLNWRSRWPAEGDGMYDNYAQTHTPTVTTRTFKPIPLYTTHGGWQNSLLPFQRQLYGWYMQGHKVFPNVTRLKRTDLLPHTAAWSDAQFTAWQAVMAPLAGSINPYYVETVVHPPINP